MNRALNIFKPLSMILFLGLASCGPSDSDTQVIQPWEIQPPYFQSYDEKTDAATKSAKLNRLEAWGSELELFLTDDLVIEEAATLSDATLTGRTVCKLGDDEISAEFSTALKKKNPIYTMMPKEILFLPLHQLKQLSCSSQIIARRANGSTHAFGEPLHFKILGENRELLFKLENAYEPFEKSHYENAHLFDLQKSRFVFLDSLASGERYRLVCRSFEKENPEARSLHELITSAGLGELDHRPDDFCRIFILNSLGVVKVSSLFQLRFFDLKNYLESTHGVPQTQFIPRERDSYVYLYYNLLKLRNLTKYPMTIRAKNQKCLHFTNFKNHFRTEHVDGIFAQKNVEQRFYHNMIDKDGYQHFVLNPGVSVEMSYFFKSLNGIERPRIACQDEIPTVEFVDGNGLPITKIPMFPALDNSWDFTPPRLPKVR